jgi:hypothetical protein
MSLLLLLDQRVPMTVSAAGDVPSGEAFESPAVMAGVVTLGVAGIASAETHGAPTLTTGAVAFAPEAIASSEAHGIGALSTGPVTVTPVGGVSAEAHGTPFLSTGTVVLDPAAVSSAEAFGAATITTGAVTVAPPGVQDGFAAGVADVLAAPNEPYLDGGHLVVPLQAGLSGVESEELYTLAGSRVETAVAQLPNVGNGSTTMRLRFAATGGVDELSIAWRGNGDIAFTAITAGVSDETTVAYDAAWTRWRIAEAAGTVTFSVSADGITWITHKSVPMPTWAVSGRIGLLAGFSGTEPAPGSAWFDVLNPPLVDQTVAPAGIGSAEEHGQAAVTVGAVTLTPAGVPSGEAHGTPDLVTGVVLVEPAGVASGEAFGQALLTTGPLDLLASGIASGEIVAEPAVTTGPVTLAPTGIASGEASGAPAIVVGRAGVVPIDIGSAEVVPGPTITVSGVTITPVGADSAEVFGDTRIVLALLPISIPSAEDVGAPRVGGQYVDAPPIDSGEAVGSPVVVGGISTGDLGPGHGRSRVDGNVPGRTALEGQTRGSRVDGQVPGRAVPVGATFGRVSVTGPGGGRLVPARR